jgi:hypothetical protein
MKIYSKIILIIPFLLLLSACSSVSKTPEIIRHSLPITDLDTSWIESAGCQQQGIYPRYFYANCPPNSPLRELGCEEITVDNLLGGLPYPIAICENHQYQVNDPVFTKVGCLLSTRNEALLLFKEGVYQLVDIEDLKSIVAPIESSEEALSYVLATTNYRAMYNLEIDPYKYFVNKIEETCVLETPTGYLVHLFYDQEPYCGCGKHYTNVVDIHVDKDGKTRTVKSRHFYMFNGCVD